jgi:hypothetical protein
MCSFLLKKNTKLNNMNKDSKKNKGENTDKKLHISGVRSSKLTKDEMDSLVIKNRIRNLTFGFF